MVMLYGLWAEAVLFHCSINTKGFGKVELFYGKTEKSSKTDLQMIYNPFLGCA